MNDKIEYLADQRDYAATRALETIAKLRGELDRMEQAIQSGQAGEGVRGGDLTPYSQTLNEVVAYGTEYRTLWNAVGLLERS